MEIPTTFNDLPTELKFLIFSFFNSGELECKVKKVCTNWQKLSSNPFIHRHVTIKGKERKSEEIISVLNANQFVHHVVFDDIPNFNWISFVEKHTAVRSVQFWFCHLSASIMSQFIDKFPNVEHVTIKYCPNFQLDTLLKVTCWNRLKSFKWNDIAFGNKFRLFIEKIKYIEEINIGNFQLQGDLTLNQLIKIHGKNLKYLSIGLGHINNATFQLLATTCVNISELRLTNSFLLTDKNLLTLMSLPCLTTLGVKFCGKLFSDNFPSVFQHARFPRIAELIIRDCPTFNDISLNTIVKCCPHLLDLTIRKSQIISNEGLKSLPQVCRSLELLKVIRVEQVTEGCLVEITNQLPKLRYSIAYQCPLINKGCLRRIVDKPRHRMLLRRHMCCFGRY